MLLDAERKSFQELKAVVVKRKRICYANLNGRTFGRTVRFMAAFCFFAQVYNTGVAHKLPDGVFRTGR